jgi:hypothetical protein
MRIRDGKNSNPGSGMEKNLDPGWKKFVSGVNIQDPQHWSLLIIFHYADSCRTTKQRARYPLMLGSAFTLS